MKNVKDILSGVVSGMKPDLSYASPSGDGGFVVTVSNILKKDADKLYVNEKMKITDNEGVIIYGSITSITNNTTTSSITISTTQQNDPSIADVSAVINFHHDTPTQLSDTFAQWTRDPDVKKEQFPVIVLLHDFSEKAFKAGFDREVSINVVIATDTKPEYKASDRYTNTFDDILIPLYEKFMEHLRNSYYVGFEVTHDKIDVMSYGNDQKAAHVFHDFIDAIEIQNLTFKIIRQ